MKMQVANNKGIKFLCAALLRFSGKNFDGTALETQQIVYPIDNSLVERQLLTWYHCNDYLDTWRSC